MLLKYFYDRALAHASYMVGCQRAKVAVVVDPGRDIDQYLEMAEREGVKLIAVDAIRIPAIKAPVANAVLLRLANFRNL